MRTALHLILAATAIAATSIAADAAALRSNKPTDDSVCDLGPNTTEVLGRKAFVPATLRADEAAEAYSRLAARFIVSACAPAQILILHSDNGRALDGRYLPGLANSLCVAADVRRTGVDSTNALTGERQKGFDLRCRIAKFDKFKSDFEAKEKAESTDAFIGRLQARGGRTMWAPPRRRRLGTRKGTAAR
jgi:hypothetical protein